VNLIFIWRRLLDYVEWYTFVCVCVCVRNNCRYVESITRGTRDPRVWCTLTCKYYFSCMWILFML